MQVHVVGGLEEALQDVGGRERGTEGLESDAEVRLRDGVDVG